jgi:hypothetical protein
MRSVVGQTDIGHIGQHHQVGRDDSGIWNQMDMGRSTVELLPSTVV